MPSVHGLEPRLRSIHRHDFVHTGPWPMERSIFRKDQTFGQVQHTRMRIMAAQGVPPHVGMKEVYRVCVFPVSGTKQNAQQLAR